MVFAAVAVCQLGGMRSHVYVCGVLAPQLEAVKALPVVQAASTPEENPTTKAAAEETVVTPAAVEQTTPPPPKEVEEKKEAEAVSKVDGEKAEAAAEGEEKKEAEASASKADEAKTEAAATTAEESTAAAQAVALETVVQAQQKELGDVKAVLNEMRGMQAALLKMMEAQAADANRRQLAEYEMRQNAEKVAKAEAERAAAAAAAAAAPALIAPGAAVVATTASTAPATVGQQPAAAPGQQQPLATPVGISPTAAAAAAVTPGEYEIAITTGTGRGAGTDATVSVALRGEKGWVELPQLGASREHPKNPFEAKQTDTFVVVASQGELGELSELRIGHDGAGMLSNWQLMEVKVCHTLTGAAWLFPAMGTFGEKGIWLKKNASKELKAQKVKAAAVLPPVLPPAAPLAAPLSGGEAGRAAHATQPTPVVAEEAAVPRAAPEGAAAVPVPVPVSADSAVVRNPMLTSLPEEEEEQPVATAAAAVPPVVPPAVPPVVRKASGQAEKAAEKAAAKAAAAAGRQSATDVQYVVQITTGGSLGAGTDADVTLELLGDKSDVWWRCPSLGASRENPANPFEQNDVDTFEVWCPVQLGELVRARIGHDGSGLMSDWQMAGVTVEAVELRKIWSFPCRSVWVKKNKPVEIAAKAVPAAA